MKLATLISAMLVFTFIISGCGKKADENKPISEVQAEAQKMNVEQLRQMAIAYKDALVAKQAEIDKLAAKVKEIPIADALGKEAHNLKADMDKLTTSVSALKERFNIYYDAVKAKGGNLSGLEVK